MQCWPAVLALTYRLNQLAGMTVLLCGLLSTSPSRSATQILLLILSPSGETTYVTLYDPIPIRIACG